MNNSRSGEILNQKYKIVEVIGEGGTGITYKAITLDTEQPVAIKNLSLRGLDNWKQVELFEREAKMLATLNHPAIPKYLDYFCVDSDRSKDFYIVQQLAPGKSLFELVKDGWRTTEAEIKAIAEQILDILVYLHGLVPAVIHRDIKPQNLIRSEDGKIFLVDFGAVQNTYYTNLKQGSTVVGTYGFMAPEQFRGQAVVATDLYNLGATIVYLLTHCPPAELPHKNLKIDFRDRVRVSHQFAAWLDKLIEPNLEHRFASTSLALKELRSPTFTARESFKKFSQTKLNLITISLIAIAGIVSVANLKVVQTRNSTIPELEQKPEQLCTNLELAQYYLKNGGNPDLIVSYDNTEYDLLFCLLRTTGNHKKHISELLKTIDLLIDKGADLEAKNNQNQTPLLYWLSKRRYGYNDNNYNLTGKITDLLISKGADIHVKDINGNNILLLTMSNNYRDTDLPKDLVKRGIEINTKNKHGVTPLSLAVEHNNLELVRTLLEKGADINIYNEQGETLLFRAAEKSSAEIVNLLLEQDIDIDSRNNAKQTAIFKVFKNRNYGEKQTIIELLISKGAKIDIIDNEGRNLLSYVAGDKNISTSIADLLMSKGLEIDTPDNQGYTPLSYSFNRGHWRVAKNLILAGADVNVKIAHNQNTPLFKAVFENNLEMTKLLIDKQADVEFKDRQGNTALMMMTFGRNGINKEILDLLISQGMELNAQNNNGDTLLSLAINHNYNSSNAKHILEMIEYLIAKGADPNIKDTQGRSVLLKAAYHNNREIIELLKKHGAKY